MKKRLFFTGPIGCGKGTAIRAALAEKLPLCGGFLTCRHREPHLYLFLMIATLTYGSKKIFPQQA